MFIILNLNSFQAPKRSRYKINKKIVIKKKLELDTIPLKAKSSQVSLISGLLLTLSILFSTCHLNLKKENHSEQGSDDSPHVDKDETISRKLILSKRISLEVLVPLNFRSSLKNSVENSHIICKIQTINKLSILKLF